MSDIFTANSGTVTLYKNVPLSNDYYDTYYRENPAGKYTREIQDTFFNTFDKRVFNNISYQRVNSSIALPRKPLTLRVPVLADELYEYNYLKFIPSDFTVGGKLNIFYAFITNVNYINPNNTEIVYEIDDFQTWFPYCEIKQSYIAREHSETDVAGDNLTEENMPLGEYVNNILDSNNTGNPINYPRGLDIQHMGQQNSLYLVLWTMYKIKVGQQQPPEAELVDPWVSEGIYNGARAYAFNPRLQTDLEALKRWIETLADKGKSAGVISLSTMPLGMMYPDITDPESHFSNGHDLALDGDCLPVIIDYNLNYCDNKAVDMYLPRNNKLLTFPYNFLLITNYSGEKLELRYEFFGYKDGTRNIRFKADGSLSPNAGVLITPYNYEKKLPLLNSITLSEFPQGTFGIDNYANWYAQNKSSIAAQRISNIFQIIGGYNTLFPQPTPSQVAWTDVNSSLGNWDSTNSLKNVATGGSDVAKVLQTEMSLLDKKRQPVTLSGNISATLLNSANQNIIRIQPMSIQRQFAKKIDEYFDAFGYATGDCKVPNLVSRSKWNYIKMIAPTINGSVPAQAMKHIVSIFENGIRLWHITNIGEYGDRTNPIV